MSPSTETSEGVARDRLRAFVERIERMNEEKAAINADISDIYKEAKGDGFDTKVLKKIIADRSKDANERMEFEAVYDLYAAALGMIAEPDFDEPRVQVQARVREATSSATPEHDPETGEITEPQPAPQAESDLTDPEPSGQVAAHPEAKASEDGGATVQHIGSADDSVTGDASRASDGAGSVAPIQPETANDDRSCASVPGGLAKGLQQQATREGEAARPLPPTMQAFGLEVAEAVQ